MQEFYNLFYQHCGVSTKAQCPDLGIVYYLRVSKSRTTKNIRGCEITLCFLILVE